MTTMTSPRTDNTRQTIPTQELTHDLQQFTELAAELQRRLDDYIREVNIPVTALANVINAERHAQKAVSHLRAAGLVVEAEV